MRKWRGIWSTCRILMCELRYKRASLPKNDGRSGGDNEEDEMRVMEEVCSAFGELGSEDEMIEALELLNEKLSKRQNEMLYGYFMDYDIFGILTGCLKSENTQICSLGFLTIINFTRNNEDFVQMFLENGLLLIINNVIKNGELNVFLLTESISILLNILKFNKIYLKRCFFVLPLEKLFDYIAINDIDLTRVCLKYAINVLQNSNEIENKLIFIDLFARILSDEIVKNDAIIEYVIYGFTIYTKSFDFPLSYFKRYDLPILLLNLLRNNDSLYILQLLRLVGLLIIKKAITVLDFQLLMPYLYSNDSTIQSEAYWCLSCAIIENVIENKTELIDFFLSSKNEYTCFNVTVESSHTILSLLKLLNYDEIALFLNNDIFDLFSRFLCLLSYPSIIIDVLETIHRIFDLSTENGNQDLFFQKLEESNCIQLIQELCLNEDENIRIKADDLEKIIIK